MRLCVFCGSKKGSRSIYSAAAREVGKLLAERKIGLVYGGGQVGMMGILADATLHAGGEVIGVIPISMVERELAHTRLTKLHLVNSMHERKALMADLADAFLALPGGYGTIEEFFEIVTWRQIGLHNKPIGLLNLDGYFDPLVNWVERAIAEKFIAGKHKELIEVGTEAKRLIEQLCGQAV